MYAFIKRCSLIRMYFLGSHYDSHKQGRPRWEANSEIPAGRIAMVKLLDTRPEFDLNMKIIDAICDRKRCLPEQIFRQAKGHSFCLLKYSHNIRMTQSLAASAMCAMVIGYGTTNRC